MLEIEGVGGTSEIILRHGPGPAERIGVLISALSVSALAVAGVWRRRLGGDG
jgi:hypothetical protein